MTVITIGCLEIKHDGSCSRFPGKANASTPEVWPSIDDCLFGRRCAVQQSLEWSPLNRSSAPQPDTEEGTMKSKTLTFDYAMLIRRGETMI